MDCKYAMPVKESAIHIVCAAHWLCLLADFDRSGYEQSCTVNRLLHVNHEERKKKYDQEEIRSHPWFIFATGRLLQTLVTAFNGWIDDNSWTIHTYIYPKLHICVSNDFFIYFLADARRRAICCAIFLAIVLRQLQAGVDRRLINYCHLAARVNEAFRFVSFSFLCFTLYAHHYINSIC